MSVEKILKSSLSGTAVATFDGKWQNQLQSKMEIATIGQAISGTYESAVSGTGGPIQGELSGFVSGDLISFVVKWPSAALTAWTGQLIDNNGISTIETMWLMTTNVAEVDEPTKMWASTFTGSDTFVR
jgi:hypothetical protein